MYTAGTAYLWLERLKTCTDTCESMPEHICIYPHMYTGGCTDMYLYAVYISVVNRACTLDEHINAAAIFYEVPSLLPTPLAATSLPATAGTTASCCSDAGVSRKRLG